jgi:hypothetical protein
MNAPTISHRVWHFALALSIGLLIPAQGAVRADTTVINPTLPATFAWPEWWSGNVDTNSCNTAVFGSSAVEMHSWRGIQSCGPRGTSVTEHIWNYPVTGNPPASHDENMFQCTELAKRYLRVAYNVSAITANGIAVAQNYATTYPDKFRYFENGVEVYPQEGDVISMASSAAGAAGHVAIVTGLSVSDTPGYATLSLMDQNGSSDAGTFTLSIENYVIQDALGYSDYNWIHPLVGIENSPSSTNHTNIYGIAADQGNVWIAGHEKPSGSSWTTVTWRWNGSNWTKFNPPSIMGSYRNHYLRDIAIGGNLNADVYTVGDFMETASNQRTLVFKWVPSTSTWTRVTSDSFTNTYNNYLYGVANAGNDNWYAVGYAYYGSPSYYNKPLLLKWNGTKFENQNLAFPSGVTSATTTDIAFSSSSNGWIVGSIGEYIYRFNGTSWSVEALPAGITSIQRITAISDSEAWGVSSFNEGGYLRPHLYHYTTASGWVEDTSFTFPANVDIPFKGIGSDGADSVWVVGTKFNGSSQPYTLRFDGSNWKEVYMQTTGYGANIMDVAVDSGLVWIAGEKKITTSTTPYYPVVLLK